VPASFVINYPNDIKLVIGCLGFLYITYVLLKVEKEKFKITERLNWVLFWKQTAVKFCVVALFTLVYVYVTNPEYLFAIMLNKPKMWLLLLCIYIVFSVYPQELIYRTFFFKRYSDLFENENQLIFFNALVFSLGHLFFRNFLVLTLTFLGGIIFAHTFIKTKSTVLVSIEHALYGCWLFTVGMGTMLGFPE